MLHLLELYFNSSVGGHEKKFREKVVSIRNLLFRTTNNVRMRLL